MGFPDRGEARRESGRQALRIGSSSRMAGPGRWWMRRGGTGGEGSSDHTVSLSRPSGGESMATREQILAETYELALQNDMNYFG